MSRRAVHYATALAIPFWLMVGFIVTDHARLVVASFVLLLVSVWVVDQLSQRERHRVVRDPRRPGDILEHLNRDRLPR